MNLDRDIERIAVQERVLQFDRFDFDTGWELGTLLRNMAVEREMGVVIDVTLLSMPVFYTALHGATLDNTNWVRRKRNCVVRFFQSSYATGRALTRQGTDITTKFGLPDVDFAAHGGSFPIVVKTAGFIGTVTVSGLPQRDDHNMVVEALATLLGQNHDAIKLTD